MAHARDKIILVVEDEPDVRMFLEACAEDAGFVVHTAEDGVHALEKLTSIQPDLITLDMVMPRMNGLAFLRKLREKVAWESIPVILITAHLRDELGEEAVRQLLAFPRNHRPKLVLEKPINPPELVRRCADLLEVDIDDEDIDLAASQESLTAQVTTRDTEILQAINDKLKSE